MSRYETLVFTGEDGDEAEFAVLEQTKVNGINYLLVCEDTDEDEAAALILRELKEENGECVYEPVEDDTELSAVSRIFEELMDDVEIE
ncbi:DUF1292 domain-containing protein [Anaerolentibacter hominis]|uniref:DUF1292 domain-containing protein n=1 Tax=Anaerolentibacter hominis TaxID=3079009 RepID=UPI0031B8A1B7